VRRDAIKRANDGRPPIGPVLEHFGVDFDPYMREQSILCPVHSEDHPSCSLNVDEGLWNCHACASGGDVYTLVMMKENCDFQSAREAVERITGGESPARHGRAVRRSAASGYAPRFRRAGSGQAVARRSWDGPPLPR
jgi:DNA primase